MQLPGHVAIEHMEAGGEERREEEEGEEGGMVEAGRQDRRGADQ